MTSPAITAAAVYDEAFRAGLRPEPLLTISEWADRYRTLSQRASAEPGPWRTERTPYLREIMDCLSPSSLIEKVVFMKGAQIGGTEAGNNWIGYVVHQAPGPMLAVQPTVEMAKRNSKQRIDPLFEESKVLRELVKEPRSRDSGNTVLAKEFAGGVLVMTGANSGVGLRSMAARYIFADEVDAYPGEIAGEGEPLALALARTRTFARRKIFIVSTPSIAGRSRIEAAYEESDRRRYWVPCPLCGEFQVLKFPQLRWPAGAPDQVQYICEHCEGSIHNHQKQQMLAKGEWRAEATGDGRTAGFHLSSLYSPVGWFGWEDTARMFEAAKADSARLQVFCNTVLAETWTERGDAPDWQRLYDRREDYPIGTVPNGGLILVAGGDVQKDRIEVEIVAFGHGKQSWSVDYRILEGATSSTEVWKALTALLNERFRSELGPEMTVQTLAIDSGYATQEVYAWSRQQPRGKVLVVKGVESGNVPLGNPTAVDMTCYGQRIRRGARVWPVSTGILKSELFGWLRLDKPTDESGQPYPPGYCHFPKYSEEYFKQLTAEQLVTRIVRGYRKPEWQKTRERNEALDCRIYARAAASMVGIDRLKDSDWTALQNQLEARKEHMREPQVHKPLIQTKQPKRWFVPPSDPWFD